MAGFRELRGGVMGILEGSETGLTGLQEFARTLTWGFAPGFGRPALQALVAVVSYELSVVSCQWEVGWSMLV